MSTPTERRDYAIGLVRATKEQTVARSPQDDPGDMCPAVLFERDGAFVAAGNAPDVDRDMGLELARVGIRGFAADSIIWCADAHVTNQQVNPATGEPWGPNGMQNACDNEGACLIGVLQDCLMVTCVDRALGVTNFQTIPYEVDKETRTVDWVEGPEWARADWLEKGVKNGYIVDVLMRAFSVPILRHDMIAQDALPLGLPGVQQAMLDEVTVTGLGLIGMKATLIKKEHAEEVVASYAPA